MTTDAIVAPAAAAQNAPVRMTTEQLAVRERYVCANKRRRNLLLTFERKQPPPPSSLSASFFQCFRFRPKSIALTAFARVISLSLAADDVVESSSVTVFA